MTRLPRLATWLPALLLVLPLVARGAGSGRAEEPPTATAPAGAPALPDPPDAPALEQAPPPVAARAPAPPAAPRRWRVGFSLGSGESYGHSYVMFGGIVGYQVAYGFELSLDGQYWGGANPNLGRVAPGVNWYAPIPFRPYVGVYYARWFAGGLTGQDALGGRAGISLASSPNTAFGAGLAFERVLACSTRCEAWWPELSIGLRF
jgi:hypothetical protein